MESVSSNLVSNSTCSVLVAREPRNNVEEKIPLTRIVVIVGSEYSDKAVKLAISLGKVLQLKLTFVNVVYLPVLSYSAGAGHWYVNTVDQCRDEGKKITVEAKSLAAKCASKLILKLSMIWNHQSQELLNLLTRETST